MAAQPPSLVVFLTTFRTLMHMPKFASTPQWRPGTPELMTALTERVKSGKLELYLTAECCEALGHKVFGSLAAQYPVIGQPLFDMSAGWGGALAQQVVDHRCIQCGVTHLRTMFVCHDHDGLGPVPDTILVAPYDGRGVTREERQAIRRGPKDETLTNLLAVIDEALAVPDADVATILKTSDRIEPFRAPLRGSSMRLMQRLPTQ